WRPRGGPRQADRNDPDHLQGLCRQAGESHVGWQVRGGGTHDPRRGRSEVAGHHPTGRREAAMTEVEWLACDATMRMLEVVCLNISERKARLLLGACCRALLSLFPDCVERYLEAAEEFADGAMTRDAFRPTARAATHFAYRVLPDHRSAAKQE